MRMHKLPLLFAFLPLILGAAPSRPFEEKLRDVALSQPHAWYAPGTDSPGARESVAEYEARIGLAIQALTRATTYRRKDGRLGVAPPTWRWGRKVLETAVLAHWYEESRFAYEVHAGIDHPVWTQDVGRARCLGQLHAGPVPPQDWLKLAGLDEAATERCALWTARTLTRMALYCGRDKPVTNVLLGMFSAMGGAGCAPTVAGRAKLARFAKMWRAIR